MTMMQHDNNLIDRLASQHNQNCPLHSTYRSHRDFGASPDLCSIFSSRLDALVTEYKSPVSTPESVMRILIAIERDFCDMGYFEEPIRMIRKNLETRYGMHLDNR